VKIITNINDLDLNGSYTYADYLTWQFQERLELFRGKIFTMSPAPNWSHQRVSSNLHGTFWSLFKNHPCSLFAAPFDVRLVKTKKKDEKVITVVQPDLGIICDKNKLDDKGCNGAPDLVVEILSPGNSKKEMGIKFDLYEENGVKEYWIINPDAKVLYQFVLNDKGVYIEKKIHHRNDTFKAHIFPKMKINLTEIF
jgi:Uma2 family endonuclease